MGLDPTAPIFVPSLPACGEDWVADGDADALELDFDLVDLETPAATPLLAPTPLVSLDDLNSVAPEGLVLQAEEAALCLATLANAAGLVRPWTNPAARPNTLSRYAVYDMNDYPASVSPLRLEMWAFLLREYPDRGFVADLLGIIRYGAKLGYSGDLEARPADDVPNLPMDEQALDHVRATVKARLDAGQCRLAHPGESVVCSPIGTVPKGTDKLRTINHLSWPSRQHDSVNAGISVEDVTFKYANLDNLFMEVGEFHGEMYALWKGDLQDAFWHVPVASKDARLLGFHLDGETYVDCTLNFGGRSSPYLFNLFAEGLHWILESFGLVTTHYLDDFFGICLTNKGPLVLRFFQQVCLSLGLSVSPKKTIAGQVVEILGIEVNILVPSAWITTTRIQSLDKQLASVIRSQNCTVELARSLAGSLLFVSRVCPSGRAFLRWIYDWVRDNTNKSPSAVIRAPFFLMEDFRFWRRVFKTWDGIHLLSRPVGSIEIWSDAATTKGYGAHLGPKAACLDAFASRYKDADKPLTVKDKCTENIMYLEAYALEMALARWGGRYKSHHVKCMVDNQVLAAGIRTGRCRHVRTQGSIRRIFAMAIEWSLVLEAIWIPSGDNDLADALSRFDSDYLAICYPDVLAFNPLPADTTPIAPVDVPAKQYRQNTADFSDGTIRYDNLLSDVLFTTALDTFDLDSQRPPATAPSALEEVSRGH